MTARLRLIMRMRAPGVGSPLGKVQNVVASSAGPTSISYTFDALSGATSYQVSVNGDTAHPFDLGASKTLIVFQPATLYSSQIRGIAAGHDPGEWSDAASATTDASAGTQQPPGTLAIQAETFLDRIGFQGRLNLQAGIWRSSTGWLTYWDEMTTARGKGLNMRTSYGTAQPSNATTILVDTLVASPYFTQFLLVNNLSIANMQSNLPRAASRWAGSILGVEGLNEPNVGDPAGWETTVLAFIDAFHDTIVLQPALTGLPVMPYSNWGRSTTFLNDIITAGILAKVAKYDTLPLHYYTGGRKPTVGGAPSGTPDEGGDPVLEVGLVAYTIPDLQRIGPSYPIWATEYAGGNIANDTLGGTHSLSAFYITEEAHAKYSLRMPVTAYLAGLAKTFFFEFVETDNDPDSFGFIRPTTWTTTPIGGNGTLTGPFTKRLVFDGYKNYFTILSDVGASFSPGTLNYSLSGAGYDGDLQHLLLQKRNGKFYLILQNDGVSYDRALHQNISVPTKSVTVGLGATMTTVKSYRPYTAVSATTIGSGVSSVAVSVPDDPLILEVTP